MKLYTELYSPYPPGYVQQNGLKPNTLFLSERAVYTTSNVYWVMSRTGIWQLCKSKKAAVLILEQNWSGGAHNITRSDIHDFLGDLIPAVNGAMKVPNSAAPIVEFMGNKFVNSWIDTVMKPDLDAIDDPEVRIGLTLLLRMLRESLCGKPGIKSLDEMLAIANAKDPDELEFRVLMMWLAAPLQQIGRNLQINMWLIGEMNGVGKGTLNSIMMQIYGADNCAILNMGDIEQRSWTDALAGKLWINVNELNSKSSKLDYNGFLKQYTTEDWLTIARRGCDAVQVLNFANWLVTSNKERPTCIDVKDRRHFLVATTNEIEKAQLATDLRIWMDNNPDLTPHMLSAFVGVLVAGQNIDETLLARAAATPIKDEVQDATGEDEDLEWWLINDERYPRDRWQRAGDYMAHFIACFGGGPNVDRSPRNFGGRMTKLARKKKIESRKSGNRSAEYRVSSVRYPAGEMDRGVTSSKVVSLNLPMRGE